MNLYDSNGNTIKVLWKHRQKTPMTSEKVIAQEPDYLKLTQLQYNGQYY
jgi:hypothetical protein